MTSNRALLAWAIRDIVPVIQGLLLLGFLGDGLLLQHGPEPTALYTTLMVTALLLAGALALWMIASYQAHDPTWRTCGILLVATLAVVLAGMAVHELSPRHSPAPAPGSPPTTGVSVLHRPDAPLPGVT